MCSRSYYFSNFLHCYIHRLRNKVITLKKGRIMWKFIENWIIDRFYKIYCSVKVYGALERRKSSDENYFSFSYIKIRWRVSHCCWGDPNYILNIYKRERKERKKKHFLRYLFLLHDSIICRYCFGLNSTYQHFFLFIFNVLTPTQF